MTEIEALRILGYLPNVTIIATHGKRYRLAFANARLRRAVQLGGRDNPARDKALKDLGWRVEQWPARSPQERRSARKRS